MGKISMYVEDINPRRKQRIGKRAISGWKLINSAGKPEFSGLLE